MCKVTYRRVLIGVVHTTLGEGYRGNTGQLDKDLTVKNIDQLFCSIPARVIFWKIPVLYWNKSSSKRNNLCIGFIVLISEQLLYSGKDF